MYWHTRYLAAYRRKFLKIKKFHLCVGMKISTYMHTSLTGWQSLNVCKDNLKHAASCFVILFFHLNSAKWITIAEQASIQCQSANHHCKLKSFYNRPQRKQSIRHFLPLNCLHDLQRRVRFLPTTTLNCINCSKIKHLSLFFFLFFFFLWHRFFFDTTFTLVIV